MNTNQDTKAPDLEQHLDQMLSAFFKAEMPDPFPPLRSPSASRAELPMPASNEESRRVDARQPIFKSRLSLAVSAALLLGGCWYLSGQIGKAPERPGIGNGNSSAHLSGPLEKANKESKKESTMP